MSPRPEFNPRVFAAKLRGFFLGQQQDARFDDDFCQTVGNDSQIRLRLPHGYAWLQVS